MYLNKTILAGLLIVSLFSFTNKESNYYVSTSGDNKNNGTKNAPYATLPKAIEVVEMNRINGDESFVKIFVEGGTYFITNTIIFNKKLSDISIEPYKNEKVVFTGGVSIPLTFIEKSEGNVDFRNRDLSLKSNSLVFKKILTFETISFSKIGLYGKMKLKENNN